MKHEIDAEGVWTFLPKGVTFAATDIAAITKDWPQVVCDATGLKWEGDQWVSRWCGQVNYITVYWAFVGAGLVWLAERNHTFGHHPSIGWTVHSSTTRYEGSHPLAAVSAAVLAAAKGGA